MARDPRPFTARSVLLSVLLGTDPPRLPVKLLVSTTELFGIAEGTTRTALSRMVATGEVTTVDGWYAIASPRLLERQARQARSRRGEVQPWTGGWLQVVVAPEGPRPADARAALRTSLAAARLSELREGVWLRPDNLGDRPSIDGQDLVAFVARPRVESAELAARLWDLPGWIERAEELRGQMETLTAPFEAGDRGALARGFVLSATVLRHLQADPLLPDELLPTGWPGGALRAGYERYDAAYRSVLRRWFDEHR